MSRIIKLKRFESTEINLNYHGAYRIRIEAVEAEGMEREVFLWRRDPIPVHPPQTNTFLTVCSPVDMAEYPRFSPDADLRYPYFRQSHVELDFRSTTEAQQFWLDVQTTVCELTAAMDRLAVLKLVDISVCGDGAFDSQDEFPFSDDSEGG